MNRSSPLETATVRTGAVLAAHGGWNMPDHFGDPQSEYRAVRDRAAIFDASHRGKIQAIGADAAGFLHNLCTNDVKRLQPGEGCEAFLTTAQAKVVSFVSIYCATHDSEAGGYWLDVDPGTESKSLDHLQRFIISEQLEVCDQTSAYCQMHLAGPSTSDTLSRWLGQAVPSPDEFAHRALTGPGGSWLWIRRHRPLLFDGFDILCPVDRGIAVWQQLVTAGFTPAGQQAYHALRVEAGTPLTGVDVDERNLPQEVGRTERAISFTKGCYIGQETIARLRTYGHVNQSLAGLKLAGEVPMKEGSVILRNSQAIGRLTSSVFSPLLNGAIALAYIRRGNDLPGTQVEVEGEGAVTQGVVVSLPFGGIAGMA